MYVSRLSLFWSLIVAFSLAGCGGDGGPANRLPTKPVKVTVTYKSAAIADATITFIPQGDGPPAYGKTDAQGVAKMKTYVEGDGAVLGQHKVSIIKSETSSAPAADQESKDYVPPAGGGAPPPVVKHLIPPKYTNPGTSGLTVEVKDSGNDVTFDLKD